MGVPLKQSEKFKYLGVSFRSNSRQNSELDIRIGKANEVMRQLHPGAAPARNKCVGEDKPSDENLKNVDAFKKVWRSPPENFEILELI